MRNLDKKSKSHNLSKASANKSNMNQHDFGQSNKEVSGSFYNADKRDNIRDRLKEAEAIEAESEIFDYIEVFYKYGQVNQPRQFMQNEARLGFEIE
jgi:hypothetical protein